MTPSLDTVCRVGGVTDLCRQKRGKVGRKYVAEGRGVQVSLQGTVQGIWEACGEEGQGARDGQQL